MSTSNDELRRRSCSSLQICPKSSAVVPGTSDVEAIAMHKDHRGLIMFPFDYDEDFVTAAKQLQLMARHATARVEQVWDEHRQRGRRFLSPSLGLC